jgi:hypothetical protein
MSSHINLQHRLNAAKLASLNVCSMTPSTTTATLTRDAYDAQSPPGAPDEIPNLAFNTNQGQQARALAGQQALHVAMVHFLTSQAI